jgi:hypothetical protein
VLICVVDFAFYDGNPASFWTEASVKFSEKIPVMYEYRVWLENVDWMARYMSVWVVIDNALWCMNDRMRIIYECTVPHRNLQKEERSYQSNHRPCLEFVHSSACPWFLLYS